MAYQTINPYTNQVVKEYPNATQRKLRQHWRPPMTYIISGSVRV